MFRVIVSEKTKDTVGDYLELLGHYDPHTNTAELKTDRIKHWLNKGAQPSGTVHNLLIDQKIIEGDKIAVANIKQKKKVEGEESPAKDKPAEQAPKEQSASGEKSAKGGEEKKAETQTADKPEEKEGKPEQPKEEAKQEEIKQEQTPEKPDDTTKESESDKQ